MATSTEKRQLNVLIATELYKRVEDVARVKEMTLTDFVSETLDTRTNEYKPQSAAIRKQEALILRREEQRAKMGSNEAAREGGETKIRNRHQEATGGQAHKERRSKGGKAEA